MYKIKSRKKSIMYVYEKKTKYTNFENVEEKAG